MDQHRSRLKLSGNFEHHWSILISGEIHVDQSLVHTFSWGISNGPMVLKVLLKFPPTLALVHGWLFPGKIQLKRLVTRPKYPPYRETGVAIPLSHCDSYGIADYRCYTPTSFLKNGLSQSNDKPNKGVSQKKLASEAYRAIGGVARNSITYRAIVGH